MLCALNIIQCVQDVHGSSWAALIGGCSSTFLLQFIATVIARRRASPSTISIPTQNGRKTRPKKGLQDQKGTKSGLRGRVVSGLAATCSWSGTPRGVRNVPLFCNRDPSYVPPRAIFLRQPLVLLVSCYLVLDLIGFSVDPEKNKMFFATSTILFFTRHGEVSREELAMRVLATLASGLGVFYAQHGVYSVVALVAAGLKLSAPRYWRPLFGSISQACTVRRFWRYALCQAAFVGQPRYCFSVDYGIRTTGKKRRCPSRPLYKTYRGCPKSPILVTKHASSFFSSSRGSCRRLSIYPRGYRGMILELRNYFAHKRWADGFRRSSGLFISVCSMALGHCHAGPYR